MAKNRDSKFTSDELMGGLFVDKTEESEAPVETKTFEEHKTEQKSAEMSVYQQQPPVSSEIPEGTIMSKYRKPNLHREIGSTQGKKGEALNKTTLRFSDDNYEYLNIRSRQLGLSNTAFINLILDQVRLGFVKLDFNEIEEV